MLFPFPNSTVLNLSRNLFKQILELSVLNSFFQFDSRFYQQIEGLGMGLPLGPTFANIFMCYHETEWISLCPKEFKPIFYKRYIDDIFLLFTEPSHVNKFYEYMNNRHSNIKFSKEVESNNKLNFLDVTIHRNDFFSTSVFRKDTFTGLGLSFFSFCPTNFKINNILTLIHRAFHICSSYSSMHSEFDFLKVFFERNGYPSNLFYSKLHSFLDKRFSKFNKIETPINNVIYLSLPYFGSVSIKLKN